MLALRNFNTAKFMQPALNTHVTWLTTLDGDVQLRISASFLHLQWSRFPNRCHCAVCPLELTMYGTAQVRILLLHYSLVFLFSSPQRELMRVKAGMVEMEMLSGLKVR